MNSNALRIGLMATALVAGIACAGVARADDFAKQQVERQVTQPYNNAPVWKEVRAGEPQYASLPGRETNVLIQPQGQTWRALHNGPIALYSGIGLVVMIAAIVLYQVFMGTIQAPAPTGRRILRFRNWERAMHWTTAISFLTLAGSGLIMFFGKMLLLPIIGYTLFGWLAAIAKNLHNFVGPLFIACSVLLFVTFVKDNIPRAYDFVWVRKFGGLFSGEHVPSHRFNAGEKVWFWGGLAFLGIVLGASGLVLDFPNFDQTRQTMQIANVVHVIGAVLFMMGAIGHIYMGTLGTAGAFEAMRYGYVDEAWAKEHHEYWYNDVKAGKIPADVEPAPPTGATQRTA
jgi:formate dehydrogenase subunit gamma